MRLSSPAAFVLACISIAFVNAQTETVVNAAGNTVVEVLTTNAAGVDTTRTLSTVTAAADEEETTSTSTSTATTENQGPVAEPATTGTEQTTYTYTTTDAEGDTTVIVDIFTPSFVTGTVLPTLTYSATELSYSEWLSLIGTNTVAANDVSSRGMSLLRERWPWSAALGALTGVLSGAWLVFA